jgi:hypothetical protein
MTPARAALDDEAQQAAGNHRNGYWHQFSPWSMIG